MMSQVKQQVQDTGSTLKKYKDMFKKKVEKGVAMMSGSLEKTSTTQGDVSQATTTAPTASRTTSSCPTDPLAKTDPPWVQVVEQMGFGREEILEVAEPLGDAPTQTQIDDLVQVLLIMGA